MIAAVVALAAPAAAFPAAALAQLEQLAKVQTTEDMQRIRREEQAKRTSPFDASKQYISTSGANAFVPPNFEAGDQRGPCPGLNALANHGYLPHNGIAGANDIVDACGSVYGMSVDLATFLAVFGTVFDGNPLSLSPGFSIGGPPPSGLADNILSGLGLLGTPQGLTGSHNKYEGDASSTRGDLFLYGNNYKSVPENFKTLYDSLIEGAPAAVQYSGWAEHHISRWQHSVNENPYFFFSPFNGLLVSPAGWSFPTQMMSNHSEQFPDGSLTGPVLKSFFAYSDEVDSHGNFKYTMGHERIPDNWYRRPYTDFSIPSFLLDVLEHGLKYPDLLSIGGNTGTKNSYASIDIANLTESVYGISTLTEGNNLLCFGLDAAQTSIPDFLGSTFVDIDAASKPLTDQILLLLEKYACPQVTPMNTHIYQSYPGYTKYASSSS